VRWHVQASQLVPRISEMFQAALGFTGGIWVRHKCSNLELPRLRCAVDDAGAFRLSVTVLAASLTALEAPGRLRRQRPRAEVSFGRATRETAFANFASAASDDDSTPSGVVCPWRFDDTLAFDARPQDFLGPGMRIVVSSQSDVRLGPLALEMNDSQVLGECTVDLRNRVLPACIQARQRDPDGGEGSGAGRWVWETPVLVVPLVPPGIDLPGGRMDFDLGVGHVTLTFGVSADPDAIMREVKHAEMSLAQRMADPVRQLVEGPARWMASAANKAAINCNRMERARETTVIQKAEWTERSDTSSAEDQSPRTVKEVCP